MKSLARARHECINSLFKKYGILERQRVFTAIANITQLTILNQGPTFQVDYYNGREA
jgi:hypothetical protein